MRFLFAALLALLALPATADTVLLKDGKEYRCPVDNWSFPLSKDGTRTFKCPAWSLPNPEKWGGATQGNAPAWWAQAAPPVTPPPVTPPPVVPPPVTPPTDPTAPPPVTPPAGPAPTGYVPVGVFPPADAVMVDIAVGGGSGAIWTAMEKAKALPAETWAVLRMPASPVKVGGTATLIDRAKTIVIGGVFDCSGMGTWWGGKGCLLVIKSDVLIDGTEFFGAKKLSNTAAIHVDPPCEGCTTYPKNVVIRHALIRDNNNGILAGPNTGVLVEDTEFRDNGSGDDLTHNAYFNGVQVVLRRVKSHYTGWGKTVQVFDAASGQMVERPAPIQGVHGIKARTSNLLIEDSDIMAGRGAALDVPYGGQVIVRNTTFRRPDGPAGNIVMIGMETYQDRRCTRGDGPTRLENITVVNDRHAGAMVNGCPSPAYIAGGSIPASVSASGFVRQ